jgi:hypothetical protein
MENQALTFDNLVSVSGLTTKQESSINTVFEKLAAEGCENYFDYVKFLGLENDPDLIALSSSHHYYYDADDLRKVKTVVNLKQLNKMRNVKDFLQTINVALSSQSYFIGSFTEKSGLNGADGRHGTDRSRNAPTDDTIEYSLNLKIPVLNVLFNILNSGTKKHMSKKTVISMLESAGLKVLDMTELNGLTYFCTNKERAMA